MKKFTLILMVTYSLMLLSEFNLNAQVDQTFWFVVPETTREHKKSPGILRITAFDKKAVVKISQPANSNFQTIEIEVAANSQEKVDFTDAVIIANGSVAYEKMLWSVENGTMDAVSGSGYSFAHDWNAFTMDADNNPQVSSFGEIPKFDKGLLIESDEDISVYYEVANENNPERFNLKGNNALGREFLIPSQNQFHNHLHNDPTNPKDYRRAREKVDIVATEDSTKITINFQDHHDFVGKPSTSTNGKFEIVLNKGQSFSLRSRTPIGIGNKDKHLGGIFITSDKKIAITISDDSIQEGGAGHWDLIGDQLIPINIAGNRYIAMHPSYNTKFASGYGDYMNDTTSVSNQVFIWPVSETAGHIYINGTTVTKDGQNTFKRGDFVVANISNNGIFIESDEPVIVYQISSYGYEMGSAVLPALECTGSKSVSFARVYVGNFFIQILTKRKNIRDQNNQNNFIINDNPDLTADIFGTSEEPIEKYWKKVPTETGLDEGEEWYSFAKLANDLSTNDVITVKFKDSDDDPFDKLFHLSVLDANGASMSYGYFSAYNSISVKAPSDLCIADGLELTTNSSDAHWYHESNEMEPFAENTDTVIVHENGLYWVEIPGLIQTCGTSEKVFVEYIIPEFDLGDDMNICPGEVVELEIEELPYDANYSWYVNDMLIEDNNINTFSFIALADTTYTIVLDVTTVGDLPCTQSNNVVITVGSDPAPSVDLIPDVICAGSTITAEAREGLTYEWMFNDVVISKETNIAPSEEGLYQLTVSTSPPNVCTWVKNIDLKILDLPTITLADEMECVGEEGTLTPVVTINDADAHPTDYDLLWFNNSTNSSITLTEPRDGIEVSVTDSNGCEADATASFGWYNETIFPSDTILICYSNLLEVEIDDSFENYSWTYDEDPESGGGAVELNNTTQNATDHILTIQAAEDVDSWAGRYYVEATDSHNCPVDSYFDLVITPKPLVDLVVPEIGGPNNDARMCEGDSIKIVIDDPYQRHRTIEGYKWSYRSTDGSIIDNISNNSYIVAKMAGTYYVDIEMDNGCGATGEVDVEVVTSPVFELSDQVACPGEEISLGIKPVGVTPGTYVSNYNNETLPVRYEWLKVPLGLENTEITNQFEIVSTAATYDVDEANRGYYRLTAFNGQGCFASEFASATSLNVTPVNLIDVELCENDSYTLTIPDELASLGGSYQWYLVSEGNDSPAPFADSPWDLGILEDEGVYTFRLDYTNPSGCFSSGTMTLTVLPAPEFTLPSGAICEGETISITAKDSYESYVWNGESGNNTFEVNSSNGGNITLEVTDQNQCKTTVSTFVTVRPLPQFSLDGTTLCPGDKTTLSVPFDSPEFNILWTSNNNVVNRNINTIEAGVKTYSVTVAYADLSSCSSTAEVAILGFPTPLVYIGDNISGLCPGDLPQEIEAKKHQMDQTIWETILWDDGLFGNERLRTANLSATDTVSQVDHVVRVMNTGGCWSRADINLKKANETYYNVGRDVEDCEPTGDIPFAEELDAGGYTLYDGSADEPIKWEILSYRWYEVNGTDRTELGTDTTYLATGSGQYVVEVFDGCYPHTATFNIDLYPNPIIAGIDSTIYQQVVVFAEGGTEPYSYTLNDMQPQNEKTFKNLENGDYTVYVIDMHGCQASTSFLFESNYDIKVPNFFTPNQDGYNDTWVIEGIEKLPESIIYIYDRYGKLLEKYGSNDPAWNGEYLNQPVPSDDYWYVIHLLPVDKYIKGNFTLKR